MTNRNHAAALKEIADTAAQNGKALDQLRNVAITLEANQVNLEALLAIALDRPFQGDFLEVGEAMYGGEAVTRLVYLKSEAAYSKDEETRFIDYVVSRCIESDADVEFMEGM